MSSNPCEFDWVYLELSYTLSLSIYVSDKISNPIFLSFISYQAQMDIELMIFLDPNISGLNYALITCTCESSKLPDLTSLNSTTSLSHVHVSLISYRPNILVFSYILNPNTCGSDKLSDPIFIGSTSRASLDEYRTNDLFKSYIGPQDFTCFLLWFLT